MYCLQEARNCTDLNRMNIILALWYLFEFINKSGCSKCICNKVATRYFGTIHCNFGNVRLIKCSTFVFFH